LACDFFTVETIGLTRLYVLLVVDLTWLKIADLEHVRIVWPAGSWPAVAESAH
jgi:hypothetical protein